MGSLGKCQKKHLGKIVTSTDCGWEELNRNKKPEDNANKPN